MWSKFSRHAYPIDREMKDEDYIKEKAHGGFLNKGYIGKRLSPFVPIYTIFCDNRA